MADNQGPGKNPNESFKNKLNETLDSLKTNANVENIVDFAKSNTQDTIAYILLLIGFILLFFIPFQGSLLLGLIFGYYFSKEIVAFYPTAKVFVEREGFVRSIILGAVGIALFINAPGLFIGAAVMIALKTFFS